MSDDTVILRGRDLTVDEVARVARKGASVTITSDARVHERVAASHALVGRLVANGERLWLELADAICDAYGWPRTRAS